MRSDVLHLMAGLPDARLRYREVRAAERGEAARRVLGLDAAPPAPSAAEADALPTAGPAIAAFVAGAPGAGATTVAASVAQLLAHEGRACGAVALGASPDLLRRLGEAPVASAGELVQVATARCGVRAVSLRCAEESAAAAADAWDRAAALLADCAFVLADVPAGGVPLRSALASADEVVVVVAPRDARAAVEAARAWPDATRRAPVRFLLNRFDARRDDDRAVRAALEDALGPALLPMSIHEDAAFAELAPGAALAERAPEAQALRDLAEVAAWLVQRAGGARAAP
jgi:hypothetical protein